MVVPEPGGQEQRNLPSSDQVPLLGLTHIGSITEGAIRHSCNRPPVTTVGSRRVPCRTLACRSPSADQADFQMEKRLYAPNQQRAAGLERRHLGCDLLIESSVLH